MKIKKMKVATNKSVENILYIYSRNKYKLNTQKKIIDINSKL
jgi:hypothetical protein